MTLLRIDKLSLAFGHRPLLHEAAFEIAAGERVALVGRNGEGKSSLLGVLTGQVEADSGEVWCRPGARIGLLEQTVEASPEQSVYDVVADGLAETGQLLRAWHDAAHAMAKSDDPDTHKRLATAQAALEAVGGWALEQRVETVLSKLSLDGDAPMNTLSGGWRRRVMLARALVSDPDVLLLDEPTNHLDISAIEWLEEFLVEFRGALLFVSHDRAFTRRLASRIIELDRGHLTSWDATYDQYIERKTAALEIEARDAAKFDKKLAEEEVWIRKGIKARRTRNEGRVRALQALRRERRARIERRGNVRASLVAAESSGRVVFDAENISLTLGDNVIVRDLSVRIMRGDRIGLIGPNGIGKTTLIRLLLGEIEPDKGSVTRGTKLQTAYFDQQRAQLEPERSVMDNVADGSQHVTIDGTRKHVAGYLRDFLFPAERLRSPVSSLSGGERNRLLLAKLFTQPANLLVLDEPTNDLDIETLELLEALIGDYQGTLLLVSHDRAFLDNTVTSCLVFEGDGKVRESVGGYSDWLAQTKKALDASPAVAVDTQAKPSADGEAKRKSALARPRKLGFKEQRELASLPVEIESLETEKATLQKKINAADFFAGPHASVQATVDRLAAVDAQLEVKYARWEALESRRS